MSKVLSKPKAKTLADFKAEFDPDVKIPNKIRDGIASLAKEGPEAWEYEQEFIRRCATSTTYFSRYRDQFAEFSVELPSNGKSQKVRAWFGNKKVAAKARG